MKKSGNNWITLDFASKEPPLQKRVKRNHGRSSREINKPHKTINFNLIEKLKPNTIAELAVHPKKIKEVQSWLEENRSFKLGQSSVLLLTGPTGAGKTATVRVVCDVMGLDLVEWVNPIDQDYDLPFYQSQASRFADFFVQSKYSSLCASSSSSRIVLVEDFPNFVIHNPQEFAGTLRTCLGGGSSVIFICTDASSSHLDLTQKLFTQEVKEEFNITTISFNPCSATLLKNLLKKAQKLIEAEKEFFCVPSTDVMDAIISSTMGDIRCAINQYQFASLKGLDTKLSITTTLDSTKGSKRKRTTSSIKSMLKDEKLGFFHGLGRVLNPKRIETNNTWRIQCDFNSLIEQFSTQPTTFNKFLQENYLSYYGDLTDVQKAADVLSQAQVFLDKWDDRNDTLWYALWIAVLGLMVYNEHKVSKWNQIKAPVKNKPRQNHTSNEFFINQTDTLYYNIIRKDNVYHTFKV